MKKLNDKGFVIVEGLLIFVAIALVIGTGFYLNRHNSEINKKNTPISKSESVSSQENSEKEDNLIQFNDVNDVDTTFFPPITKDQIKYAKRYRFVSIDNSAIDELQAPKTLKVVLFNDVVVKMRCTLKDGANGSKVLSYTGVDGTDVILTILNGQISGSITAINDKYPVRYNIRHITDDTYLIFVDGQPHGED